MVFRSPKKTAPRSGDFVSGVSRANSTASKWLRSNPGACAPVAECLEVGMEVGVQQPFREKPWITMEKT